MEAAYRFFKAASEQVEMVLCLEFVSDLSIGTAPSDQSCSWSTGSLAEKFQRVPHALLTMVREGDFNWPRRTSRHLFSRRTDLQKKIGFAAVQELSTYSNTYYFVTGKHHQDS